MKLILKINQHFIGRDKSREETIDKEGNCEQKQKSKKRDELYENKLSSLAGGQDLCRELKEGRL